ncbi:methyltransferase domain-containing protein [Sarocladium implicatum]|nr:methyltransferase domain-containing protein [Sarocladium implicatum]
MDPRKSPQRQEQQQQQQEVTAQAASPTSDEAAEATIEIQEAILAESDDADSALGLDLNSSVASLSSSVLAYHEENGRSYHGLSRGKYVLPNDSAENERLDLQHELFIRTSDGELALCPKAKGARRVLDMGTGTGSWAIDYADWNPEAEVIGVDLSPIQPDFVPPNLTFEIDDLEKEWTWRSKFDFIFARMMLGTFEDLPGMIKVAFDNLEPGGYLELQDMALPARSDDGTLDSDSYLARWCKYCLDAGENLGRPVFPVTEYKKYLADAGFEAIVEVQKKWPTNAWPRDKGFKELGIWSYANIAGGLEGLSLAHFTRGLGWSAEETQVFCAHTRKDLKNTKIHAYWPIYFVYGRKPFSSE